MSDTRPVIGDFRTSANKQIREERKTPPVETPTPAPTTAPAADTLTPAQEKVLEEEVKKLEDLKRTVEALTPAERYQKNLEEAGVLRNDAATIYDAVLSKGYYEEYIRLGKSTRAVFRTRLYEDALRLQTALEHMKPQLAITQDDIITRYNMAASLYEWQGKPVPHVTEEDFVQALALVRRLPGPVYSLLASKLMAFDMKVMAVFSEGAAENFS